MCPDAEKLLAGRAAWGAQAIPLPGHYRKGWITLASGGENLGKAGDSQWKGLWMWAPEWFRDRETGRQEEDLCCQGEHLVPGPWTEDKGHQVWMVVCRKPTPGLQWSLLWNHSLSCHVSPVLGLIREKGENLWVWRDRKWGWGVGWREQKIRVKTTVLPMGSHEEDDWLCSPISWAVPFPF